MIVAAGWQPPRRRAWRRRLPDAARPWLFLAPALLVLLVLFVGGLGLGFAQSLGYLPFLDGGAGLSLDAYRSVAGSRAVQASFALTFRIAVLSTVLSAVGALAAALLIRSTARGRRLLTLVFQLNLGVPHLVGGIAILLLLGQAGLLSRGSAAVGLTAAPGDFPALTNDAFGAAIIAQYVWKEVPFVGVVLLAALGGRIAEYEAVAATLGASARQRLRHVVVPLLLPALVSTSIIVFAFTFGSYEVPFLLGQPFPAALPVVAYRAYVSATLTDRPEAMAIAVLIAVVLAALVAAYLKVTERAAGPVGGGTGAP